MNRKNLRKASTNVHNQQSSNSGENNFISRRIITNSLDIPNYQSRMIENNELERRKLLFDELSLFGQEVDTKARGASYKANGYNFVNTLSSLAILTCAAVITAVGAINECENIVIIVFGAIVFVIQGAHELIKWGEKGFDYKKGESHLRSIRRETLNIMRGYHNYNSDQIITSLSHLQSRYDEIDLGLYGMSITDTAKYSAGEQINDTRIQIEPHDRKQPLNTKKSSPHIHIHVDGSRPSTPNTTKKGKEEEEENSDVILEIISDSE